LVQEGQIQGIVLTAFEKYYGTPPFIEQVVLKYYPDSATALAAYREGEVMGISQITQDVLAEALKEPDLSLYTGRLPRLSLVYLNLDDEKLSYFQDVSVRRALLMGTNRQWIQDRLLGSQAIIADGPILPGTWAYYDGIEHMGYDPDAAIALLKEAGYTVPAEGGNVRAKDGISLDFEMVYPDEDPYPAIAEAIQRDWRRLGINVDLKAIPYEELVSDFLETRNYEAALAELNLARSPDPDPYPFWHQAQATGGQNYARWDDRQASEYLEQARVLDDSAERTKRYRNFQVRFSTEMPALPLFYPVYSYAVDNQVRGVSMGPLFDPSDRFATMTTWFIPALRATETVGISTSIPTDNP
jgi:peptide/nickel transport system substrate-binding protein